MVKESFFVVVASKQLQLPPPNHMVTNAWIRSLDLSVRARAAKSEYVQGGES